MINVMLGVLVPGLGCSPSGCWSKGSTSPLKQYNCLPEVDGHGAWKNQDDTNLEASSFWAGFIVLDGAMQAAVGE